MIKKTSNLNQMNLYWIMESLKALKYIVILYTYTLMNCRSTKFVFSLSANWKWTWNIILNFKNSQIIFTLLLQLMKWRWIWHVGFIDVLSIRLINLIVWICYSQLFWILQRRSKSYSSVSSVVWQDIRLEYWYYLFIYKASGCIDFQR